jgi:hypothetical protein
MSKEVGPSEDGNHAGWVVVWEDDLRKNLNHLVVHPQEEEAETEAVCAAVVWVEVLVAVEALVIEEDSGKTVLCLTDLF